LELETYYYTVGNRLQPVHCTCTTAGAHRLDHRLGRYSCLL